MRLTDKDAALKAVSWDTAAYNAINMLPTIEQPQWIPCSERLPDKDGVYEVTCKSQDGIYTARSQYSKDGRFYESYGTHTGYHKWAKLYDENGYDIEITAWMPLPEPYKEDADEQT